ncbi:hypothetical protein ACI4CD_28970, partial [Klebsiella pneumoniae]|uniref:hypothetical protein n=1 Tax=Klebsiella pneumoniae TaxID=573 RepID=UPI003854B08A
SRVKARMILLIVAMMASFLGEYGLESGAGELARLDCPFRASHALPSSHGCIIRKESNLLPCDPK